MVGCQQVETWCGYLPRLLPQADQYQFAWTGADDEGELACCGTLLYDGTTCYTLTIRCAAELEKTYHAEFARILAHTRLTDAA